jgi:hypothetical protein
MLSVVFKQVSRLLIAIETYSPYGFKTVKGQ